MKEFDEKVIEGRRVRMFQKGEGGPLVLLATSERGFESLPSILQLAEEGLGTKDFSLAAFSCSNWDDDYAPWCCSGLSEGDRFGGKGPETLAWINEALIPVLRDFWSFNDIFIVGYSLAGLFALWSTYESELFSGCGCCSGSLWFDGWGRYMEDRNLKRQGRVYLSLGGKEEKSPHPVMATIGNATRFQDKLLEKDPMVTAHKLEMNPGGHFSANDKRIAKAIVWLLGK